MLKTLKMMPNPSSREPRGGWTLAELLVAVAAASVMLTAFVATTITLSRTMIAVSNYNDLDQHSRIALDQLSQDVRNSAAVSSASTTTSLILSNNYNNSVITYAWDGSNAFTRTIRLNGVTASSTLMTSCDAFAFAYFQRNPLSNFGFVTASNTTVIKMISVSWRCSRQVLGSKLNTESVQTAKVVMRN